MPEVLLADGDLARQPLGVGPDELREGVERRASVARRLLVNLRPTAMRVEDSRYRGACESGESVAKRAGGCQAIGSE